MKEGQDQLQLTVDEKSKRVGELLDALKDARENELKLEESFRMELAAQKKLVTIYQSKEHIQYYLKLSHFSIILIVL